MQISFLNSYWDIVRFSLYHNYHFWLNRVMVIGVAAFAAYQLWSMNLVQEYGPLAGGLTFMIMLIGPLTVMLVLIVLAILLSVSFQKNASYRRQCTLTLGEEGVRAETPVGNSFVAWAGIPRVVQTGSFTAIYCGEHAAHVVPARVFDSASRAREFYDYALSQWKAHRAAKSA